MAKILIVEDDEKLRNELNIFLIAMDMNLVT